MIQLKWGDEEIWKDSEIDITIEAAKALWAEQKEFAKKHNIKLPPDPEFRVIGFIYLEALEDCTPDHGIFTVSTCICPKGPHNRSQICVG